MRSWKAIYIDERERLLRQIFGDKNVDDVLAEPEPLRNTQPLFPLHQIWPDVVDKLQHLLIEKSEAALAGTVQGLQIYDRCRCGYCATAYVQPPPEAGTARGIAM